jgi:hypothetical protein
MKDWRDKEDWIDEIIFLKVEGEELMERKPHLKSQMPLPMQQHVKDWPFFAPRQEGCGKRRGFVPEDSESSCKDRSSKGVLVSKILAHTS